MNVETILPFLIGTIVILFGIGTLLNPNLARFIQLPGNAQIKAFLSIVVGIIFIIIGIYFNLS